MRSRNYSAINTAEKIKTKAPLFRRTSPTPLSIRINFKSQFQSDDLPQALKYIKIASKVTSIVTILVNIAFAGEHIFQVLGQYS